VAKTASNMNLALTLNWFLDVLEKARLAGRHDISPENALSMIHIKLYALEKRRLELLEQERIKRELSDNPQLAEVLS
jgi:hypothetical protein